MIGTTAAIILGSALAGSRVAGSVISSHAATNAAKTQTQAGRDAMAIEQQAQRQALDAINQNYGRAQGLYDPYIQMGQNAMPSLQRLAGSGYPGYAMPQGAPPQPQGAAQPQPQSGGSLKFVGASQTPAAQGQPQMVTLRAPNGMTKAVPQDQADHYIRQGAQVVN